jgi:2-methylcitrate dehydratase
MIQGSYAVAPGVAKGLALDEKQRRTRSPFAARHSMRCGSAARQPAPTGIREYRVCCPHATLLAMRGITGPLEVFGNKGLMDSIADAFEIDWSRENLERVTRTVVKK